MKFTLAVLAALSGLAFAGPAQEVGSSSLSLFRRCQSCCPGESPPGKFCDCNIFGCNCEWYSGGGATKLGRQVNTGPDLVAGGSVVSRHGMLMRTGNLVLSRPPESGSVDTEARVAWLPAGEKASVVARSCPPECKLGRRRAGRLRGNIRKLNAMATRRMPSV
ncbi:hypothetical protein RJ55_05326 [Drechmeria coniospora]|nr:hypothetical protein RJ55_05326 [Drechmeria coniospora]